MKSLILRVCALLATSASLTACMTVNAYKGVPMGNYTRGSEVLTPAKIADQNGRVLPRCKLWAKETTPSPGKLGAAMAFNHAQAGFIGGAGGYASNVAIVGAALNPLSIAGVGVANAINAGAQSYVSGKESVYAQRFSGAKYCLIMDINGTHAVPPSEAKRITNGQQAPTSYGAPAEWGSSAVVPPPS
ncbi:hypothetical protein H0X32_01915 [Patescibacteria group bacterium]|nr:hypothetical protein [Patescibacteria group bacterium]